MNPIPAKFAFLIVPTTWKLSGLICLKHWHVTQLCVLFVFNSRPPRNGRGVLFHGSRGQELDRGRHLLRQVSCGRHGLWRRERQRACVEFKEKWRERKWQKRQASGQAQAAKETEMEQCKLRKHGSLELSVIFVHYWHYYYFVISEAFFIVSAAFL